MLVLSLAKKTWQSLGSLESILTNFLEAKGEPFIVNCLLNLI